MICVSLRHMPISNTYKIQSAYDAISVKRKRIFVTLLFRSGAAF